METAVNLDLIPSNPARKVPKPRTMSRERTVLTLENAQAVLRVAESHRFHALWWFVALTGARKGEVALGGFLTLVRKCDDSTDCVGERSKTATSDDSEDGPRQSDRGHSGRFSGAIKSASDASGSP